MTTVRKNWGMACPDCGCDSGLSIEIKTTALLTPDGTDIFQGHCGDHNWDDHSEIYCRDCDHTGPAKEFRVPETDDEDETPEPFPEPLRVRMELRFGDKPYAYVPHDADGGGYHLVIVSKGQSGYFSILPEIWRTETHDACKAEARRLNEDRNISENQVVELTAGSMFPDTA